MSGFESSTTFRIGIVVSGVSPLPNLDSTIKIHKYGENENEVSVECFNSKGVEQDYQWMIPKVGGNFLTLTLKIEEESLKNDFIFYYRESEDPGNLTIWAVNSSHPNTNRSHDIAISSLPDDGVYILKMVINRENGILMVGTMEMDDTKPPIT